jgi:nucleoside-diphosphate-sugar epimerase
VINNLVGYAVLQGTVLMKSDGTPWRPLIHIEDISRAFAAALSAPADRVHNEVFNVGVPGQNYQIRQLAQIVEDTVPGAQIRLADEAGPDIRDYRVDAAKISEVLPEFKPVWTVEEGVLEMYRSFVDYGTGQDDFLGKLLRIRSLQAAQAAGWVTDDLRIIEERRPSIARSVAT